MKDLLFSFLLTSFATSFIILLLSLTFAVFKSRISIRTQYFTWSLVLASLLIPFRPQFGLGLIRFSPEPIRQTAVSSSGAAQPAVQSAQTASQSGLLEQFLALPWFEIFFALWLLGFLFSLGKYAYSYIRFQKLLKRWGEPVTDADMLEQLQAVQQDMRMKGSIGLLHYPMAHSPLLVGLKKAVIVLPELDYTEEELSLIFKHELTHYRHRDVWVNLLGLAVKSLYWFNPIIAFACKESQEAGEMYCDHDVLFSKDSDYRTFYGETILTMINRSRKSPLALTTCFYSNKFNLKRRIVGIMDNRLPRKFLSAFLALAAAFLLLLSGSVFALEDRSSQTAASLPASQKGSSSDVSQQAAVAALLKELSLSEKDIADLQVVREKDTYHISFSHGQTAYENLVSAKDGKLLRSKQHTVVEKTVTVEKEV
ncbi:M56 family metallopeptidase, partial [Streptococcus sp. DD11]|uniref:M56 family metallopeptidase n=1 Tax=Streptococcus sp. DD11 TaxID=1777879 RepID=UPI0013E39F8D